MTKSNIRRNWCTGKVYEKYNLFIFPSSPDVWATGLTHFLCLPLDRAVEAGLTKEEIEEAPGEIDSYYPPGCKRPENAVIVGEYHSAPGFRKSRKGAT
ncbi:MAG: hypothetical protein V3R64_07815 [Sphingomonadales bacterium]